MVGGEGVWCFMSDYVNCDDECGGSCQEGYCGMDESTVSKRCSPKADGYLALKIDQEQSQTEKQERKRCSDIEQQATQEEKIPGFNIHKCVKNLVHVSHVIITCILHFPFIFPVVLFKSAVRAPLQIWEGLTGSLQKKISDSNEFRGRMSDFLDRMASQVADSYVLNFTKGSMTDANSTQGGLTPDARGMQKESRSFTGSMIVALIGRIVAAVQRIPQSLFYLVHFDFSLSMKSWLFMGQQQSSRIHSPLQPMVANHERIFIVPVVVLGDPGIGKTTLIRDLTTGRSNGEAGPTSIFDFTLLKMQVDNKVAEVQIWEVNGYRGMTALGPSFLQEVDACILIHDSDGQDAVNSLTEWKTAFEGMAGAQNSREFPMVVAAVQEPFKSQKVDGTVCSDVDSWAGAHGLPVFKMRSMADIRTFDSALEGVVRVALNSKKPEHTR